MTTTNHSTEASARGNGKAPKLPTHVAKVRHGYGKKATYERIGVAWRNDDGSLYVKLSGTQVVSALTLYELEANTQEDAAPAADGEASAEEAGE
jgi:hypothetical protein